MGFSHTNGKGEPSTEYVREGITAFGQTATAEETPVIQATFPYTINNELVTESTSGSGSITWLGSLAVLGTGTTVGSSASIQTVRTAPYRPGQGMVVRFACAFGTPVAGTTQEIGIGDSADGLFFRYNGTTFEIVRRVNSSESTVSQSAWSEDKADGTGVLPNLDWEKGNVFMIKFQWLGYGAMTFYVENPATGEFVLVHRIEYANTSTSLSMRNPTLPITMTVDNGATTSNITFGCGSMMAAVEGKLQWLGPDFSQNTLGASLSATTESALIHIRPKSTVNSQTNRTLVRLLEMNVVSDGTKPVRFILWRNPTYTGTPSWSDVDADSTVEQSSVQVTVTGGIPVIPIINGKLDSSSKSLWDYNLDMHPGEEYIVTAYSTSSNTPSASLTWKEMI